MNTIREIERLNQRELEKVVPPEGSWHADYRDTAYVYVGGLPFELTEGDVITIFSQYGEPTYVNLIRDKETGKSKGFGFVKYEDQRSCDLAVDNLGGAKVLGRILRVDHTRYKKKDEEEEEELKMAQTRGEARERKARGGKDESVSEEEDEREMLPEERELMDLIANHDDDDPMKSYLVEQKKEEVAEALKKLRRVSKVSRREKRHKDKSERRHRERRSRSPDEKDRRHRREREKDGKSRRRSRSDSPRRERGHR